MPKITIKRSAVRIDQTISIEWLSPADRQTVAERLVAPDPLDVLLRLEAIRLLADSLGMPEDEIEAMFPTT